MVYITYILQKDHNIYPNVICQQTHRLSNVKHHVSFDVTVSTSFGQAEKVSIFQKKFFG
jgi:hypothetical protein